MRSLLDLLRDPAGWIDVAPILDLLEEGMLLEARHGASTLRRLVGQQADEVERQVPSPSVVLRGHHRGLREGQGPGGHVDCTERSI